jgi:tRNA (cmo5U34)-methyltransferase
MTEERKDRVWQSAALTEQFLTGIRGAIPLAQTQIDVMLQMAKAARPRAQAFMDLGCGDGILGHALLGIYPDARGVFVDFSEPMLDAARKRLGESDRLTFLVEDYGPTAWLDAVTPHAPFDVIVSGFSIHHQTDERKQAVYREIYDLLTPGGIFLNLEHVKSPTRWVEQRFDEAMIDATYAYHLSIGGQKSRQQVADEFYYRPDKAANILAPLETQLGWLRDIGYQHVDCYLKIFELALFGGVKPAAA